MTWSRCLYFLLNSLCCRADVVKALNEAIDKREEGLVIKSPSSVYKPNLRSGKHEELPLVLQDRTTGTFAPAACSILQMRARQPVELVKNEELVNMFVFQLCATKENVCSPFGACVAPNCWCYHHDHRSVSSSLLSMRRSLSLLLCNLQPRYR